MEPSIYTPFRRPLPRNIPLQLPGKELVDLPESRFLPTFLGPVVIITVVLLIRPSFRIGIWILPFPMEIEFDGTWNVFLAAPQVFVLQETRPLFCFCCCSDGFLLSVCASFGPRCAFHRTKSKLLSPVE